MEERPLQVSFNGWLRVDFQGSRVTSDSGLLLVRELDERLGLGELIEQHLADGRGKNTQLPLTDLMPSMAMRARAADGQCLGQGWTETGVTLEHLLERFDLLTALSSMAASPSSLCETHIPKLSNVINSR